MGFISNIKYRIERELVGWGLSYHLALFSETGRTELRLKRLERISSLEAKANKLISQYCNEINPIPSYSNLLDLRPNIYRKNLGSWLEQRTDGWIRMIAN